MSYGASGTSSSAAGMATYPPKKECGSSAGLMPNYPGPWAGIKGPANALGANEYLLSSQILKSGPKTLGINKGQVAVLQKSNGLLNSSVFGRFNQESYFYKLKLGK